MPSPRQSSPISPARAAAFQVLLAVYDGGKHSDDALHSPALTPLTPQDRNLATTLVLGTLRWWIALEARIRPLLNRPDAELGTPILLTLQLGAFQLLHLDRIPAHAAINEAVELARSHGQAHAAGMVNAILRKLATTPKPRQPLVEAPAALAERLSHPRWLVERWIIHYGRATAERLCEHNQVEPAAPSLFTPDPRMPAIDDGSRLVAELAAAAHPSASAVWDACAAPGGKTVVLAHRLPRARILVTDISPRRTERLAHRLRRELPEAPLEIAVRDAALSPPEPGAYDLILCDLPCTGTGTLSRNPEIKMKLEPADLSRQSRRQEAILRAALPQLAPGGRLVFSTCSMEPEENQQVLDRLLASNSSGITLIPASDILPRIPALATPLDAARLLAGPFLRTLPGSGFSGDGFFAAVLAKS